MDEGDYAWAVEEEDVYPADYVPESLKQQVFDNDGNNPFVDNSDRSAPVQNAEINAPTNVINK